jgi:hypothetical protein
MKTLPEISATLRVITVLESDPQVPAREVHEFAVFASTEADEHRDAVRRLQMSRHVAWWVGGGAGVLALGPAAGGSRGGS